MIAREVEVPRFCRLFYKPILLDRALARRAARNHVSSPCLAFQESRGDGSHKLEIRRGLEVSRRNEITDGEASIADNCMAAIASLVFCQSRARGSFALKKHVTCEK